MKWIAKACAAKVFSYLPMGSEIHYYFQRRITKSLPCSDIVFNRRVATALTHLDNFRQCGSGAPVSEAAFFEFGAGWDLQIPLTYCYLGVRSQTIIDIRRGARPELIADSIGRLDKHFQTQSAICGDSASPLSLDRLEQLGITYLAPVNAANTGLRPQSFDFISNTDTLEHIPVSDLTSILQECFRLLKPGGVMSCLIDLTDHYAHIDSSISCYNFLKFSPSVWALANSPALFQNRLRYPDYLDLARRAGFRLVTQEISEPTQADLVILTNLTLADQFGSTYSPEALGVKTAWIVLKRDG